MAQGYVELEMFHDARAELEAIHPEDHQSSRVLAVRLGIYAGLKQWALMQVAARVLSNDDPAEVQWSISLAYATRRAESIGAAKAILLAAVEQHPEEPMLHYNLACYECQGGDLEVALARLQHAFKLEPRLLRVALEDEDLEPLGKSLEP